MSAISSALDNIEKMQIGENNNSEYCWSKDIRQLITQFNFQMTRNGNMKELEDKYQDILKQVFVPVFNGTTTSTEYIKIIYKLIGYTRDIVSGKGEYTLSYMLISGLYKFSQSSHCPENDKIKIKVLATSALESLVRLNINEHPYGSWKDLKYFCNYHIKPEDRTEQRLKELNDPLFNKVVELICGVLQCDENSPVKTLLAKWVPREKSAKFGWITTILAVEYYKTWINNDLSYDKVIAARKKCLTHFRQLVSKINKQLNTPQINQCNGTWANIDFEKNVTSITLRKQGKAFQGKDKNGNIRSKVSYNEDRLQCKNNYEEYITRCKTGVSVAKGKRVAITDFVKDAILARSTRNTVDEDCINSQWINNAKQNNALGDIIAMVDTSGSMEEDNSNPLYSAIGLGIRIAEKSKLGKRVLTFNSTPTWVNLSQCSDFVSMVDKIKSSPWGMNTNFKAALDLILDSAISNNIAPDDMTNMTLIILSDMQIDNAHGYARESPDDSMFKIMEKKYHDAGVRSIYNQPYSVPHIVFWNLRYTSGFPSLSTTKNTSMMSGNSPVLLNAFCNHGIESLKEINPWNMLVQEVSNERYNHLENIVTNLWP